MSGWNEGIARLMALPAQVRIGELLAVDAENSRILEQSQQLVPVGHLDPLGRGSSHVPGSLKASGRTVPASVLAGGVTGAVSYGDENTLTADGRSIAVIVHEGSPSHPIDPVSARFLHFLWEAQGREIYTLHVEHPGFTGRKYLERPVLEAMSGMGDRLAGVITTSLGGAA